MPQKRKAAAKKDVSEKTDSKKKAKPAEKESADEGDEAAKEEVAVQDSGSKKSDVHITSSKACQAFAKRHVELEESKECRFRIEINRFFYNLCSPSLMLLTVMNRSLS